MGKSTYIQSVIDRKELECKEKITELARKRTYEVLDLEHMKKPKKSLFSFIKPTAIIGFVLMIIGFFGTGPVGGIMLFLLPVLAGMGLVELINYFNKKKNDELDAQIQRVYDLEERRAQEYCDQRDAEIHAEEQRFYTEVGVAMNKYSGSQVIEPLVLWLFAYLENKVKASDRGAYVERITAEMRFNVYSDCVEILEYLPHANDFKMVDTFDFFKNRYNNIEDFEDRVGFTEALTKQIEFQINMAFPEDPLAPKAGVMPDVIIEQDDCAACICYDVENPNYRPSVDF